MEISVRPIQPADYPRWQTLWDAYTRFYEREPDEQLTAHTWNRILDPNSPIFAIVAEAGGNIVGIANCVLHESTGSQTQVCYLQDLFVDPETRGLRIGQHLIDYIIAEARTQSWSRVYWHTKETNYRARTLYDHYGPHSGFVRYVVNVE